jgi:hypothetical protein
MSETLKRLIGFDRMGLLELLPGQRIRRRVRRDRSPATRDVRRLLGRSRRPPIRGHTSSVPRHGLRGVGGLEQLPKAVC